MILSNSRQDYNAAIVLNNIGVDLLERRCYLQALATLLDATNIMQAVLRRLSSSESNVNLAVEAMLHHANRRIARPTPMESNSYYRIVNLADNYCAILLGEEDNGSLKESIFPIRIYDVSYDACSPGCLSDPEMQSAIILHNMGLAYLCLARVTPQSSSSKRFIQLFAISESIVDKCSAAMEDELTLRQAACLNMAIQLFEMSESIVEKHSAETEDELTLKQAACLNMAILFGLLQSLSSEDEIESVQLHLRSLRSALSEIDDALSWLTTGNQGAPAA
jgi:hypothetical protein